MSEPDLTPLTDEQRRMVESVIPMIHHFRRKSGLVLDQNQYDDYLSYGYEKLCQAARAFDPKRGAWTTFVGNCILRHQREWAAMARMGITRTELRSMREVARGVATPSTIRAVHAMQTRQSLDDTATADYNPLELLRSDALTPEEREVMKAIRVIVDRVLALRPERHREVFLSHVEGEALAEIARRLGISRERARQINEDVKQRILKEMKQEDHAVESDR